MWFRLSEHSIMPGGELVGLFTPESVEGPGKEGGKAGSVAVTKDGRKLASPFGLKVLAKRYKEGKI